MPGQHALLSPSAAHRWLNCTAAPRLEATAPDKDSTFAQEGTLAHAYCAAKLKEFLSRDTSDEAKEIAELNERYHTGEMDEYTDAYKTIVLEKYNAAKAITADAQLLIETRLDFGKYMPEAFGTADAVIIADGCMEIIDFKYGKGVRVSAHDNPQMKIYAMGAYEAFSFEYNINRVRMTIVQPRLDNLSEFELTAAELQAWAENELQPKAKEAFSGNGQQKPGPWCQFCRVACTCKALAAAAIETQETYTDPTLISAKDMAADVLPKLAIIKAWASSVEEYALKQALAGTAYPGYKLVAGRSVRKITDPAGVRSALSKEGYHEDEYLKPQELRGIGDLEKLIGKKRFAALCAPYITKPAGSPTLVPNEDKRPALNQAEADFNDIEIK